MIVVLIGTRAQLIKMAPVLLALERQGTPYRLLLSGQHAVTMPELLAEFGVATPPVTLYAGAEITGVAQMARWSAGVLWRGVTRDRERFRPGEPGRHCMVVHGDTVSTLLGAVLGRWHGLDVVHVEAGLTSGHWREPFPEELTRRLVFRLADVAFCPGAWAADNMRRYGARIVDSGANTIVDAVREALARCAPQADAGVYAVVSLHRYENIFDRARFAFIVDQLRTMAERVDLVFVLHPATARQAERFGLLDSLARHPRIALRPRMTYVPFLALLTRARFVVSDGGSNQEELACLGIPTLLMRRATERQEGLGDTTVLACYEPAVIARFVDTALARPSTSVAAPPGPSPAAAIAHDLARDYGT